MRAELAHNTYSGLHAAHYDRIYADKPYAEEADFVARLLHQNGSGTNRLLDLACGTGRHAREFAAMGWEVTGVDYSEELLEAARANAPDVTFHCRDIRTLDLEDERFDAVTCLFDSIGYPQTDEGVVGALTGARAHLRPAGTLVVEFLHATAMRNHSPTRIGRWPMPDGGELVRISNIELDRASDLMHVSYQLFDVGPDGVLRGHSTDELSERYFTLEGMHALMRAAELRVVDSVPAYVETGRIDESVWHVLVVAKPEGTEA